MITTTKRCAGVLLALVFGSFPFAARPEEQKATPRDHFLLVWAGDRAGKGNDFLVVINADPASPDYGHLVTTLATDQQTVRVHHTEYTMPASGMLFANDHDVGRTFIFDVRNPRQPKIAASFADLAGYMHPHSYLRLPNGHVLATFQHAHHSAAAGDYGKTGGLVEINDAGEAVRAASNADAAFPSALLMPYGLVVIPEIDRVVSTNSSMHDPDIFSGVTYQVWRLSDLRLLKTANFDVGENLYAHISPEEPRLGPDGSVFVQTLGCGVERITGIETAQPRSKLVYTFPGNWCGVPTIVGHYFVQSVPAVHGLIVLSIADPERPVEVSRLSLSGKYFPHWTGWDPVTRRLVVNSSKTPEERMYLVQLDEKTGALSVDRSFRDTDGQQGFSFNEREWPHGWRGAATPHGAVFTR
jgi:56kDa selenium binding protein (SBP56)